MTIPNTPIEALAAVMRQAEEDLASAHAEICRLQGLDPAQHSWPEWSPQANSLRWFRTIREKFPNPQAGGEAEAMREAAAKVAEFIEADRLRAGFGQPLSLISVNGIPAAIRALPLPAGDTLSTGGWNSDMEKAPKGTPVDLWRNGERLTGFTLDEHGRWTREEGYPSTTRVLLKAPTYWRLAPEPPPGE